MLQMYKYSYANVEKEDGKPLKEDGKPLKEDGKPIMEDGKPFSYDPNAPFPEALKPEAKPPDIESLTASLIGGPAVAVQQTNPYISNPYVSNPYISSSSSSSVVVEPQKKSSLAVPSSGVKSRPKSVGYESSPLAQKRPLPPPPLVPRPRSKSDDEEAFSRLASSNVVPAPASLLVPPKQTVYASPQVSRVVHKPSLGCTLLARPEQSPSTPMMERKHSFVAKTSLSSLKCGFCNRLRTSAKCFVCSQCGISVHKQCVSLVTTACTSSSSKSADAPVMFVSANQKHRGLRVLNLTTERILHQGYLFKQSIRGDWNMERYFVLIEGDETLFYFASEPKEKDKAAAVPTGGYPLSKASVVQVPPASDTSLHSYQFCFSHHALDRQIILATDSYQELDQWLHHLRQAISHLEEMQRVLSPQSIVWPSESKVCSVFSDQAEPRSIDCLAGDECDAQPLFVRIDSVSLSDPNNCTFFCVARLYFGGHNLCSAAQTSLSATPDWSSEWLLLLPAISSLPPEAVLMLSAYRIIAPRKKSFFGPRSSSGDDGVTECLGHVHLPATDYGLLRSGTLDLKLWPGEGSPIHFHFSADHSVSAPTLRLSLPVPPKPIYFESFLPPPASAVPPKLQVSDSLLSSFPSNPLMVESAPQRVAQWQRRANITSVDQLPAALLGADYTNAMERNQGLKNFLIFPPFLLTLRKVAIFCSTSVCIPVPTLLYLLSGDFSSSHSRALAARGLFGLSDEIIALVLPLLVSALRFEPFLYNLFSSLLLVRCLRNPALTHALFWSLISNSDAQMPQSARFRFLRHTLQSMLDNASARMFVEEAKLAEALSSISGDENRKKQLDRLLQPFARFDAPVRLPLFPTRMVNGLQVEKCKVMSSNAAPLLLRFDDSSSIIVKSGDDLRQDMFALLFGRLLASVWRQNGVEASLIVYGVCSTAQKCGMIEAIPNCTTVGSVQNGIAGALKKELLVQWFASSLGGGDWNALVTNFVQHLAGSCVFEYLLGIGDRHADNILVRADGSIFHIDFAYLMGCKTTIFGIARETQPFTFTPSYLEVLGGSLASENGQRFVDLSTRAFLAARKHHYLLSAACIVGLAQESPNLKSSKDLNWILNAFALDKTEAQAAEMWKKLIEKALSSTRQQLNDMAHNLVQKMKK